MSPSCITNRLSGVTATTLPRPPIPAGLAVEEFDARDWRKDELIAFARTLGIPSWGKKPALASRVRKQLFAMQQRVGQIEARDSAAAITAPEDTAARDAESPVPAHSVVSAPARPQFFREVPGQTRAQALAAWYASRKAQAGGSRQ